MADELRHADVGNTLTKAEYDAILGHILNNQARGDMVMSNAAATGLIRLAGGAQNTVLVMGANDPNWASTLASLTLTSVTISSGTITGITDLAIGDGGTGQSSAAAAFAALEQAASTSATGTVELATTAEVTTGTDTTRAVTPNALADSEFGEREVQITVYAPTGEAATGDDQAHLHISDRLAGMNLLRVHAEVITAGITGLLNIQVRNDTSGNNMLSTAMTIDSTETGTDTAATPAVVDAAEDDVAENDLLAIDIDAVHSGTLSQGLIVTLIFGMP